MEAVRRRRTPSDDTSLGAPAGEPVVAGARITTTSWLLASGMTLPSPPGAPPARSVDSPAIAALFFPAPRTPTPAQPYDLPEVPGATRELPGTPAVLSLSPPAEAPAASASSALPVGADPPTQGLRASPPAGNRNDDAPSPAENATTPRGPGAWLSVPPFRSPNSTPGARGAAVPAPAASMPLSPSTGSEASGAFSLREAVFVTATAAAAAPAPQTAAVAATAPPVRAVEATAAARAEEAAAAAEAVEVAVSGSASRRRAGELPRSPSRGRLDVVPAAPTPLGAAAAAAAAAGPGAADWVLPGEDILTEEEAQAIIDAADMEAAEAVVVAAEAEEAVAAAATPPARSPAAGSPAVSEGAASVWRTMLAPTPSVARALSVIAAAEGEATAHQNSGGSGTMRALTPMSVADDRAPLVASPPNLRLGEIGARAGTGGGGAGAASATALSEEQLIADAVAAVAEFEARDRLQSRAGGTSGGGGGGGGGPVAQAAPGDSGPVHARCAWCRSSLDRVAAPGGAPSNSRRGREDKECRNCGRAVCDSCVGVFWARSMVPTHHACRSNAYRMRVCKKCDSATEAFRKALLLGQYVEAMSAYETGCVNLDRPYTIYHGELPVHCAAAGGNVRLLAWLLEKGCRLFMDGEKKVPVRDLRKLTPLGAAAVNGQVQAMRYLVNEQGCSVSEIRHLPTLKRVLKACLDGPTKATEGELSQYKVESSSCDPPAAHLSGSPTGALSAAVAAAVAEEDEDNCCVVCFDSEVNCTLVPCGHHCCCVGCASKFSLCPVCRTAVRQRIKAIPV